MKAKIFSLVLVILLGLSCVIPTAGATDQISVVLNGKTLILDVPVQVINGRTLVPARAILEGLGMTVNWNNDTQTVTSYKQGVSIIIPINSATVIRNMVECNIDIPAQIINGRTFVPVRFVSEFAGATVNWDETTRTVNINSNDSIKYIDWNDECFYCGEVKDSVASGYGAVYNKQTEEVIEMGLYDNYEIVEGALFDDDEELIYIGMFENGKASNGIAYEDDGTYYEGPFENGLRHGVGTIYDSVNNIYLTGNFENDYMNGIFSVFDIDTNTTYEVVYENGTYLGAIPQKDNYTNIQGTANDICLAINCDEKSSYGYNYCYQHKCREIRCNEERAGIYSSYCENHECADITCNSKKANNSMYCSNHKCFSPLCSNKKASNVSTYCINHECIVLNCTYSRALNTPYCIIHQNH